jgi:hypothetical protein
MLSFESTAFPVADGQDAETNPGIFGKALAEWLSLRLNERGVKANPPFPEDWGWCVELASQKHRTGLACASEDNSKTTWRVYAFLEPGLFGGLRGKDASIGAVNDLIGKVRDILSNRNKPLPRNRDRNVLPRARAAALPRDLR